MKAIEICTTCKGYGQLAKGVDYNPRSGYDSWEKIYCNDCFGTGKVIVTTIIDITKEPFNEKVNINDLNTI